MEKSNIQLTGSRYFAYIDLLGFSNKVKEDSISALSWLKEFLDSTWVNNNNTDYGLIYFSDTIIVYMKHCNKDPLYLKDICAIAREITINMLSQKIPIRGVIHYGELNIDFHKEHYLFYGKGLIKAHHAEPTNNIVGLFLLNDAINAAYPKIQPLTKLNECNSEFYIDEWEEVYVNMFLHLSERNYSDITSSIPIDDDIKVLLEPEIKAFKFIEEEIDNSSDPKTKAKYEKALHLAKKSIDNYVIDHFVYKKRIPF